MNERGTERVSDRAAQQTQGDRENSHVAKVETSLEQAVHPKTG